MSVYVSQHPLVLSALTQLRDRRTPPPTFRWLVRLLTQHLFSEATRDLELTPNAIETPLMPFVGQRLRDVIGLVPILRAGLGMTDAILDMLPEAQVWHLGLYRDHQTLKPITYYNKLHPRTHLDIVYVVDPMLATGGSAVAAIDELKKHGLRRIRFLGLIAAPEGVAAMREQHPDVPLYLAAVDEKLNEIGYIVPGLGDAGDRQFGTLTS